MEGEGEDRHRHQCLVRWVLKMRAQDRNKAHQFLHGYETPKGWVRGWNQLHPNSKVEADCRDQWAKGNRGEPGEWK